MGLSPRDPALSRWHNFMADAEIGLRHFDAAIDECNKAIDGGYRVFYSSLNLAVLAEARRLNPKLSVK